MIEQNTSSVEIDEPPIQPPAVEEAPPPDAVVPQPAAVAPPPVAASPMLCCLLRMADDYMAHGSLWQAMEIYMKCVEQHDGTPEAGQACECLLKIAERHEKNGKGHLARSIYERLL